MGIDFVTFGIEMKRAIQNWKQSNNIIDYHIRNKDENKANMKKEKKVE